ncbi:hypothetical protein DXG01_000569 [Tephrocybe rancida]|nr:hypothetical protein DXG01_000569 [Tephrocybe rancida]
MDVVIEILRALPPRDLAALSVVNRAFRHTTLVPTNRYIWVEALAQSDLMPCPTGLNIYAWIHLISGRPLCQECGLEDVPDEKINFWLLRRICLTCQAANLITTGGFQRKFKDHSRRILKIVRYTRSRGGTPWFDYPTGTKQFWMPDVTRVYRKRWECLSSSLPIDKQIEMWIAFGERRKELFNIVDQVAKDSSKRAADIRRTKRETAEKLRDARFDEICRRFRELGFDDADVDQLVGLPGICIRRPLTDSEWDRVKERYYQDVVKAAAKRLRKKRQALVEQRKARFKVLYWDWVKSSITAGAMAASQFPLLPRAHVMLEIEPFRSQIDAPSEVSINFAPSTEDFEIFVSSWTAAKLREMDKLLPKSKHTQGLDRSERLNAATAVFRCTSNRLLMIGYKKVLIHNDHDEYDNLEFFHEGSAVVKALLPLFGVKDLGRCLPSDLDDKGLRFCCLDCGIQRFTTNRSKKHLEGRKIFTWRECVRRVSHAMDASFQGHRLGWEKLSDEDTCHVKSYETNKAQSGYTEWSCAHCAAHVDRSCSFEAVSKHLDVRSLATSANDVVNIVEVGPRDGLQNEKGIIPVDVKVELINRLARAGAQNIETGSFVSPKWVPQMGGTSEVISKMERLHGVHYAVLVPNQKGLANLVSLLDETQLTPPVSDEISIFTAATDAFTRANLNMTTAESLQRLEPVARAALDRGLRVRGYVSVAIACPYSGPVDFKRVREVTKALADMGCYEVSLGDTVGQGTPTKVTEMIEEVKKGVPVEKLAFHDTYGTAVANVFAALAQGIRTIDSSVGGLGGCPYSPGATGNVATEDVLYALKDSHFNVAGSNNGTINIDEMVNIGWWISEKLGKESVSRAGRAIRARKRREEGEQAKLKSKL